MINKHAFDIFTSTYKKHLAHCVRTMPHEYHWSIEDLDSVCARMSKALENGRYSKDSPAFKATCKELGIKCTYKAIYDYLNQE